MAEICIEAQIEKIGEVLDFFAPMIEHLPPKIKSYIGIMIDEIVSNIIYFGYDENHGLITVSMNVNSEITLEFEDDGMHFNPLEVSDPDVDIPTEERDPGGLGIFLVKKLSDAVYYQRKNQKNYLTVIKKIN